MAVRMGPRLAYELDLPGELAQHAVPALLLQPLVENSIQHGLERKVGGGRISVSARRDDGVLLLEVSDTGVGPSGEPATGKGFGMVQVRERLATLYGTAADMQFAGAPGGGARTIIRLPLKS
jgi:LytS/YehU family sensor histidine kinase